jgi:hypothetical protein
MRRHVGFTLPRWALGLLLIPGVNKLERGGVWISHRLAKLLLVPGVNKLERVGFSPPLFPK